MSGLTNTTGFSFLGLTNLTQGNFDNLFINNLTANTGTITILNSTTGTITTLNSTTANITTLLTDLWRGTSAGSSMVIGVIGDTGTLTSYRSLIMGANKTITLNATGGKILCNLYEGTSAGSVIQLFPTSTAQIEIGNSASSAYVSFAQDLYMGGDNNIWSPNFTYANNFSGTAYANPIRMFEDQTEIIYFGNKLGTGAGILFQDNASFSANRVLTMDATGGKIKCDLLTGTATSSNMQFGEVGDTGIIRTRRDLYIGSTPFGSNKGIYCNYFDVLTPTDSIIFCATQTTGTLAIQPSASGGSGTIFIGNSINPAADTSSLFIYKNTALSSTKLLSVNTIRGVAVGTTISLFSTTTAGITIGGSSSGITLGDSVSLGTNDNLTLSGTGKITTPAILVSGLTANKLVLTDASDNLVSSSFTDTDFARLSADNVFTGTTNTFNNTLACNTLTALSTTATGSLFGNILGGVINIGGSLTGTMNIGNTGGGNITINPSVVLSSGKNITLQGIGQLITSITGAVKTNYFYGVNATDIIRLFDNTTSGDIYLGNSLTSGNIIVGLLGTTGTIQSRMSMSFGANKNLTMDTSSKVVCDTYEGTTPTDAISLFSTTTTPNITLGSGLTLGAMFLGNLADNNPRIWIYNDLWLGTTATNRTIYSNTLRSLQNSDTSSLYNFTTTGSVNFGGALTSGNINIHNSAYTTGKINLNAPVVCPDLTLNSTEINLGTSSATSQGAYAIAIGSLAGGFGTQESQAVAIGYQAGYSNQAGDCVAIGFQAQYSSTVAVGSRIRAIGIGYQAQQTNFNQGIAIGDRAGNAGQGIHSIAMGSVAGGTTQGNYGIAIGRLAGQVGQKAEAVAMGFSAGQTNQGTNAIAIGSYAGQTNQAANSIVINATAVGLNGATASACYINPLRSISGTYYTVWDTTSKEFGYLTSSKKRKCNIKDFNDTSSILKLQPKSYNFKGDDSFRSMIGHIAEDVYAIDPRLTIQEDDKPNALEYFTMMTFAINELKKLREEFDAYKLAHP